MSDLRTNCFRVFNKTAFYAFCNRYRLDHWESCIDGHVGLFHSLASNDPDGWPSADPDTGKAIVFTDELAALVIPTDVAILIEYGTLDTVFRTTIVTASGNKAVYGLASTLDAARLKLAILDHHLMTEVGI